MKKFPAFLFLLVLPFTCFSQDIEPVTTPQDHINMDAKLNFFTPFDVFNFPTLDLSLEHRVFDRFSVSAEGGYELYHFNAPDTSFVHPNGFKLRTEVRFYRPFASYEKRQRLTGGCSGFYIGLDFFYRQEQYNSSVSYTSAGGDTTVHSDDFWTKKRAHGINFTMGYQWAPARHIIADVYMGTGVLQRNIDRHELSYSEAEGDEITADSKVSSFFAQRDLSEKNGIGFSLAFGLRVGYIFY